MTDVRPKTIFCDIDGTLFKHKGSITDVMMCVEELLPGVVEKFAEWDRKGYNIILVTGRRESARERTENQLKDAGIFYDRLIMGIGGGVRILINDEKPGGEITAEAICLKRNEGIGKINV